MFKRFLIVIGLITTITVGSSAIAPTTVAAMPHTSMAQVGNPRCAPIFLTFPVWYRGLPGADTCNPQLTDTNLIWVIVLNIIEVILQVVGYSSAGFIIWGGIRYTTSAGDPGKLAAAKNTIMNAIIGLIIAMSSIGIVNFVLGIGR